MIDKTPAPRETTAFLMALGSGQLDEAKEIFMFAEKTGKLDELMDGRNGQGAGPVDKP